MANVSHIPGYKNLHETPEERMAKFDAPPPEYKEVFRNTATNMAVKNPAAFVDRPGYGKAIEQSINQRVGESTAEVYGEDHPQAYNYTPLRY